MDQVRVESINMDIFASAGPTITLNDPAGPSYFVTKKCPQIIAALIASIGSFSLGTVLGWSSPVLPALNYGVEADSWIGSIAIAGALTGGLLAGFAIDKFGRKLTITLLTIPIVLGWYLIVVSHDLTTLLIGRFITGDSLKKGLSGAYPLIVPVYISETSEDHLRGMLSSMMVLLLVIGILFTYVLGSFLDWIPLTCISGVFPVILNVSMLFMPESPRYLLDKGKTESAVNALMWLRGTSQSSMIQTELNLIQGSINESRTHQVRMLDLVTQASIRRPTIICLALMFFQQFGGITAITLYSSDIFKDAGGAWDPNVSSIIIGTVQVVAVGVSTLVIEQAGRRALIITSEIGMSISLMTLGLFFYLKHLNGGVTPEGMAWVPLLSLFAYMMTYNIGMSSIPWVMIGELLPPHVKGLTSGLATAFSWAMAFLVSKTFPNLISVFGDYGCYTVFGVISVIGAIYAYRTVPETKGKSLDEIQRVFDRSTSGVNYSTIEN